jgi:hypothetical protein
MRDYPAVTSEHDTRPVAVAHVRDIIYRTRSAGGEPHVDTARVVYMCARQRLYALAQDKPCLANGADGEVLQLRTWVRCNHVIEVSTIPYLLAAYRECRKELLLR